MQGPTDVVLKLAQLFHKPCTLWPVKAQVAFSRDALFKFNTHLARRTNLQLVYSPGLVGERVDMQSPPALCKFSREPTPKGKTGKPIELCPSVRHDFANARQLCDSLREGLLGFQVRTRQP